jgi:2-iminobutanoate/2-iminopropanoate deaminase
MKEAVKTDLAPAAVGPYSQGVVYNGMVFVSGQLPVEPGTGAMPEGMAEQTKQALKNVSAVLEAAGSGMEKVVRTTVYIKNIDEFMQMNAVYSELFGGGAPPARSAVEVSRLPKGALIEIDAIAYR